tara:strand:+ start:483 stop:770 length:288 start_codon:yes stop_codon:yes gene_type:complete
MKSAYELAMERLNASDPDAVKPLTEQQKKELFEIDQRYKAKKAEREIFLNKQLEEALLKGESEEAENITKQISNERLRLEDEREEEKNKIRNSEN